MREVPEGHKWCTRCKASHPKQDFYKNAYSNDGLQNWCKPQQRQHEAKKYLALKIAKNVASQANT